MCMYLLDGAVTAIVLTVRWKVLAACFECLFAWILVLFLFNSHSVLSITPDDWDRTCFPRHAVGQNNCLHS